MHAHTHTTVYAHTQLALVSVLALDGGQNVLYLLLAYYLLRPGGHFSEDYPTYVHSNKPLQYQAHIIDSHIRTST